ncbi:TPA: hypothetical protein SEZ58_001519 [Campylobacter coli]|nr:hypothetical protein [Campylobacter coli]
MRYKVAVQFYGHARTFRYTYDFFKKNILEANKDIDFDVFIHTWDKIDHDEPRDWYKKEIIQPKLLSADDLEFIKKRYNPIGLKITPQKVFSDKEKDVIFNYGCSEKQYIKDYNISYSMQEVNRLRKDSKREYDLVITTRLDILFKKPFYINMFLNKTKSSCPYLKFSDDILRKSVFYPYMRVCDLSRNQVEYIIGINLFFFGCPSVMDECCNWHNNILTRPAIFPLDDELWITKKIRDNNFYPHILYYELPEDFIIFRENMKIETAMNSNIAKREELALFKEYISNTIFYKIGFKLNNRKVNRIKIFYTLLFLIYHKYHQIIKSKIILEQDYFLMYFNFLEKERYIFYLGMSFFDSYVMYNGQNSLFKCIKFLIYKIFFQKKD